MDKKLTIKERFLQFAEIKGISKVDFYKEIGAAASNFKGVGMKSEIGSDKIVSFLTSYPEVSPEWLLTGNGKMLKQDNDVPVAVKTENMQEGIPLIPLDAMAGFCSGEMQVMEYECERYVIPAFREAEFLIPVKGSSMYPKYSSGDIVACKKLTLSDIFFQWNKVYVLDTDQGALIKRVRKGKDENHILLVSENERYDPFELRIEQIHAIAIVIGVIRLE